MGCHSVRRHAQNNRLPRRKILQLSQREVYRHRLGCRLLTTGSTSSPSMVTMKSSLGHTPVIGPFMKLRNLTTYIHFPSGIGVRQNRKSGNGMVHWSQHLRFQDHAPKQQLQARFSSQSAAAQCATYLCHTKSRSPSTNPTAMPSRARSVSPMALSSKDLNTNALTFARHVCHEFVENVAGIGSQRGVASQISSHAQSPSSTSK